MNEPSSPVKCWPICPKTKQPCTDPCTHLKRHMPNDGRERKLLGSMPLTCGRTDDETGLSKDEVVVLQERCSIARQYLVHMQNSLISMGLDSGIDSEQMKAKMAEIIGNFFKDSDGVDHLVVHAAACTLAIATLEKWKP